MVVWYSGPGQYNNHSNGLEEGGEGEDRAALRNLERNIANLERSMSASQLGRGKGDLNSLLSRQVHCEMQMSIIDSQSVNCNMKKYCACVYS